MKAKGLCIATRCASVDELVARFRAFVGEDTIFIATTTMRDVGVESTFAILLGDKTTALRGQCVVVDAWSDANNPYKRPGIRCRVFDLTPESVPVFERLKPPRQLVTPAVTPAGIEPERCTPTIIGAPPLVAPAAPAVAKSDVDDAWGDDDAVPAVPAPTTPAPAPVPSPEPAPVPVATAPAAKQPLAPPQAVAIPEASRVSTNALATRRVATVQIPALTKPRTATSKAIAIPSRIPPVRAKTEAVPVVEERAAELSKPVVIPPRKTEAMPIALSTEAADVLSRPIVIPPRTKSTTDVMSRAQAAATARPSAAPRARTEAGPLALNAEALGVVNPLRGRSLTSPPATVATSKPPAPASTAGTFHEEIPTLVDEIDPVAMLTLGKADVVAPPSPPKRTASGSGPQLLADGTGAVRKDDAARADAATPAQPPSIEAVVAAIDIPVEVPIDVVDTPTERAAAPMMIVAEGSAATRTPGSQLVLPANPLMHLTDRTLEGLVELRLWDRELDGEPAPSSIGDEVAQLAAALPGMEGPGGDDDFLHEVVAGWTPVIPRRMTTVPPTPALPIELTFDAKLLEHPRPSWHKVVAIGAITVVIGFAISFAAASLAKARAATPATAQTTTK